MSTTETMPAALGQQPAAREKIFDLFRRWGYLQASLDPLGFLPPEPHPELELSGKAADEANGFCESLAPEVFELGDADVVQIADGPVPPRLEIDVRAAVDQCPKAALRLID